MCPLGRGPRGLALLLLLLCLVSGGAARGRTAAEQASTFDEHYRAARRLYDRQEFTGAAGEFLAAYELRRDPRLLLNAGNALLMAGQIADALRLYERCAAHRPPLDAASQEALRQARALAEERLKKAAPAETPAPTPAPPLKDTPAPAPAPAQGPAAIPMPAARPAPVTTATARPAWRSPWLWGALSAVVVAGVVTGAVLGTRAADPLSGVPEENRFQLPF